MGPIGSELGLHLFDGDEHGVLHSLVLLPTEVVVNLLEDFEGDFRLSEVQQRQAVDVSEEEVFRGSPDL